MATTKQISSYVTGLSDAGTLDGTEELYLASDEKTTVSEIRQGINTKEINIGDWDMDATVNISVAHGVADYKKIRSVEIVIRNDADTLSFAFTGSSVNFVSFDSTNINMSRATTGVFDTTDFDSTSYNRGFITIHYID